MFGFQRVKLIVKSHNYPKIITIPQLNNFKLVLTGDAPNNSEVDILLECDDQDEGKIYENLGQQFKNLKLYLNLNTNNVVDIIEHDHVETFTNKNQYDRKVLNSLDALKETKLSKYLNERYTQQHVLLQSALDSIKEEKFFEGFSALVNWLDDNEGNGRSRFCPIRNACSHGKVDDAIIRVNEMFPEEFEFEDNVLIRNSQKNIESMKRYIPEILERIKEVFRTKYVT